MRWILVAASFVFASLACAQQKPVAVTTERTVTLPLRQIALYKNGVGFFELSGKVTGNALIQIDFTSAQLNDVLQSLTAVDLGGGHIAGLGYEGSATLGQQLDALHLGLGPDPTVMEFLQALKGTRVEVRSGASVVTGKLLNVEVRPTMDGRTGARNERRFVSVVTNAGTLRTLELTPSVQVTVLEGTERTEIGKYLAILATTRGPETRHLTLEAIGTGEREIHIGYISALPAWKSSYRLVLTNGAKVATLEGFAIVDNTTSADWENVQLTLVSGAPQSFIQQISRPNNIARPEIAIQGGALPGGRPDPIAGLAQASVAVHAGGIGGGDGVQVQAAKTPAPSSQGPTDQSAPNALSPYTSSVALDDLFEYKLAKPMTIRHNASFVIPIVETTLDSEQVSQWLGRSPARGLQRAFWLRNTSGLTLDQGSFTVVENGIYAGQGQIPPMHPNERRLTAYGADESVKVEGRETKPPKEDIQHIEFKDGTISVHRKLFNQHAYTVENLSASARAVVLDLPQSPNVKSMGRWNLSKVNPPEETIPGPSGDLYRFELRVDPHSTASFTMLEFHHHPTTYVLAKMSVEELAGIIHESGDNADVVARLQPIVDARKKLAELDAQLRDKQRAIDEVNGEEARLRQNIATLKGSSEEKSLSKRYSDGMLAQEDKLAGLQKQREEARQQRSATEKSLDEQIRSLHTDIKLTESYLSNGAP